MARRLGGLGLRAYGIAALTVGIALASPQAATATSIGRVTRPEMERKASVVFVGTARRVREQGWITITFRANRFLRGGPSRVVTITSLRLPGIELGIQAGGRYLIFAEPRRLGNRRVRRLVPMGYPQGVYALEADGMARNEWNGPVHLERLAYRLAGGPPSSGMTTIPYLIGMNVARAQRLLARRGLRWGWAESVTACPENASRLAKDTVNAQIGVSGRRVGRGFRVLLVPTSDRVFVPRRPCQGA